MTHTTDHQAAEQAAAGVRAFMASFGVSCDVLPAGDRVVIHLPTGDAADLVSAAHARGIVLRYPPHPDQLSLFDDDLEPALSY